MSSSSKDRLVSHPHQSLWRHLASVEEVSGRALNAKMLAKTLFTEHSIDFLRQLLVYFHDFGKGTDFFQWMIINAAKKDNPDCNDLDEVYVRGFPDGASALVAQIGQDGGPLRGHSQLGAFVVQTALPEDTSSLLRAIIYEVIARHHGNLRNFDQGVDRQSEAHEELLEQQWEHMNHTDYREILKETPFDFSSDLDVVRQRSEKFFFSDVYRQLNRNESLLPYLQTVFLFSLLLAGDKGDLMLPQRDLVGRVRRCGVKLIEQYKTAKFGAPGKDLMNVWREEAYQQVVRSLVDNPDAGFYSITLPTGMGKTLTAYNAAIQLQNLLADKWQKENPDCTPRIIYCLPFTSVIDQNAAILEDILSADPDMKGELAKHHYLADWTDYKGDRDDKLTYSEKEYLVEGWEYTLTVTTFVQILETIVSNRNRKLRKFHNLANAIIVLDEVQSIPPKYFNLVSRLFVLLHEQLGTRFMFVTATQPLLMNPADGHEVIELTDPTKAYTRLAFERMDRIDLDLNLWLEGPDDIESLTDLFAQAISEEADSSFLIILNLVKESQEVFHALAALEEPGVEYLYLSSAILPVCRKLIIDKIKDKESPTRKVVVSTQVVEAGVDIDLDVVYRAFAPLDSINQSAGRCNRNMTVGKRGSVRVFKNEKAAKMIYDVALLSKTERTLQKQLRKESKRADSRPGIVPEGRFYEMNLLYMEQVSRAVAEGNQTSIDILEDLQALRFEAANEKFKVIKKTYTTFGVFIDDPDRLPKVIHKTSDGDIELTSSEVYKRMTNILHNDDLGRWDKKQQLRLLRPALLQYVVQFPEDKLPADLHEDAEKRPFIRLHTKGGDTDYSRCYNLTTGYFKPEEKSTLSL